WDALRMNMMISYQELVRTFLSRFYFGKNRFFFHIHFKPDHLATKRRLPSPLEPEVVALSLSICLKNRASLSDAR
ncbi:hypothetical protein ACOCTV_003220, partial [Escherichia coli]